MALKCPKVKVRRLYSILAINLLTTAVFLFVLNMMAFTAIKIKRNFFPSRSLTDLQVVYPDISPSDISLLLKETWNRPWQYEPWLGFRERPRSGNFVNISDEGFRHSHNKNIRLDSTGINIYVFGGSTTFGYGLDDAATIPSHLQNHLSSRYPAKTINVFNFGRGYYYSTQELALLLQLIRNNHIPAIAIFIDGLNEGQTEPYYTKEMSDIFNAYNYEQYKLLRGFIKKSSLNRLFRKLHRRMIAQPPEREYGDPVEIYESYSKNKEIINILSEKFNFRAYFFIQPVPGYHNKFLNHMFMPNNRPTNWNRHMMSTMQLLEKSVDNKTSFSLTHLLEDYRHQPFVDNVHYTSKVCDSIATNIAKKIKIPLASH